MFAVVVDAERACTINLFVFPAPVVLQRPAEPNLVGSGSKRVPCRGGSVLTVHGVTLDGPDVCLPSHQFSAVLQSLTPAISAGATPSFARGGTVVGDDASTLPLAGAAKTFLAEPTPFESLWK